MLPRFKNLGYLINKNILCHTGTQVYGGVVTKNESIHLAKLSRDRRKLCVIAIVGAYAWYPLTRQCLFVIDKRFGYFVFT